MTSNTAHLTLKRRWYSFCRTSLDTVASAPTKMRTEKAQLKSSLNFYPTCRRRVSNMSNHRHLLVPYGVLFSGESSDSWIVFLFLWSHITCNSSYEVMLSNPHLSVWFQELNEHCSRDLASRTYVDSQNTNLELHSRTCLKSKTDFPHHFFHAQTPFDRSLFECWSVWCLWYWVPVWMTLSVGPNFFLLQRVLVGETMMKSHWALGLVISLNFP